MPSAFRDPPLFSSLTIAGGLIAAARSLGQSRRFLETMFHRSHGRRDRFLDGYAPGPQDLFVATFPKSGTNWSMQIAVQLAWHGKGEFDHIHSVVPWLETPFPGVVSLHDNQWKAAPEPVHVIKTAIELDALPTAGPARFLTVIRDPKEVVVSAYLFLTGVFGMRDHIRLEDWLGWWTDPDAHILRWSKHTHEAWSRREQENVLVLLYPEMRADPEGTIQRIADHIGVSFDEPARSKVLERASFAWMKAHDERFGPPRIPFTGPPPPMMRRGVSGGSGELLTPAQQAMIDDHERARLAELGSDFPYDEVFGL